MKSTLKSTGLGLALGLGLFSGLTATAQNGLEKIIVEKYYISNANDATVNGDGGVLPVGSVTYRVYVDMKPGYKFQAAYGVNTPGAEHELRIATSTLFFNNEDRGAINPTFTKLQAKNNTVMLDSWLSVGAACAGNFGVLKADDNGVSTVVNADEVLANSDAAMGIPLTQQDGLMAGTPEAVTMVGITNESAMFADQNDGSNGPTFSTFNGSWASLNGSAGYDTTNKVLIGQFTTNGAFSFNLNIQLGLPGGGTEKHVASNPVGNEILCPTCIYASNVIVSENKAVVAKSALSLYPNPSRGIVNLEIKSTEVSVISIYNVTGTLVYSKSIAQSNEVIKEQIDLSSMVQGMYFVELNCNGSIVTRKVSKF